MRFTFCVTLLASVALSSPATAAVVDFQDNFAQHYIDVFYTVSPGGEFTNWDLRVDLYMGSMLDSLTNNRSDNVTDGALVDTFVNTVFSSVGAGPASYVFTEYHPGSAFPPVPAQQRPTAGALPPNPDQLNWTIFDTATGDGNIPGSFPYHMARLVFSPFAHYSITATFFDTTNTGVGETFETNSLGPAWTDFYDDGETHTDSSVNDQGQYVISDGPPPLPNPTTYILVDGFSLASDRRPDGTPLFAVEDTSLLENRGGTIFSDVNDSVFLQDSARFIMSGGAIDQRPRIASDDAIRATDASRVDLSGGVVSIRVDFAGEGATGAALRLTDAAQLHVTGGDFSAKNAHLILADGTSATTILDGSFSATGQESWSNTTLIRAAGSATIDVHGGTFASEASGFRAADQGTINVYGGDFTIPGPPPATPYWGLQAEDDSIINVFGSDFALDGAAVGPGFIPQAGLLTGVLSDGSPFALASTGRIFLNVIPEPSALALAAIGLIGTLIATRGKRLV